MNPLVLATQLVLEMLQMTGPSRQVIQVNPSAIVDLRTPRSTEHFAPGTNCIVFTADGKYILVIEKCEDIKAQLRALQQNGHRS